MKPIPSKILTHTVTLKIPSVVDEWGEQTTTDKTLEKVCVQPTNATIKSEQNTEVVLRAIMFVDALRSTTIDMEAVKNSAEGMGCTLFLTFGSQRYAVQSVDTLYDERGRLHHYEVGLV